MFCPNCGQQVSGNSNYCINCGKSIINLLKEQKGVQNIPTGQPLIQIQASVPRPVGFDICLSIVFAVVALFFLPPLFGGLGIYFSYRIKQKGKEGIGVALMVVNGACLLLGMFLGALSFF